MDNENKDIKSNEKKSDNENVDKKIDEKKSDNEIDETILDNEKIKIHKVNQSRNKFLLGKNLLPSFRLID